MIAFDDPVRPEVVEAIEATWDGLGRPGTWWTGAERIEIAALTRAAQSDGRSGPGTLPAQAAEAVRVVAADPANTSEEWVRSITGAIGEPPYVELVGVVVLVTAVDTFHRLLGVDPPPLPAAAAGEPTRQPPPEKAKHKKTWVAMEHPIPPFVLGAVPAAMKAMNRLSVPLYMTMDDMALPDWERRGLHRTQVELVAAATSHVNECFY